MSVKGEGRSLHGRSAPREVGRELLDSAVTAAVGLGAVVTRVDESQSTIGRAGGVVEIVVRQDVLEIAERGDSASIRQLHQRPSRNTEAASKAHDGQTVATAAVLVPTSQGVGERATDSQQAGGLLHGVKDRWLSGERLRNSAHDA